ncbi:hypothetical protein RvY_00980 [Ramazzottius varieornatus]|uniref:Uncharacterized protein n=1 Tax=Ramazzottius varieornatus TaxID=947166 RepID=A0A1D1UFL8_RAMVA|nr:hypothetical protein RvY_00980 [Ramazzottius varieornatus]
MLKNRNRNDANDSVAKASHQLDSAQKRNLLMAMDAGVREGSSADVSALGKWYNDDLSNVLLEFDLKDI